MILQIQTGEKNSVLRQKDKPVKEITADIKQLCLDMAETLATNNGIGLAGPQVGKNLRIICVDLSVYSTDKKQKDAFKMALINPKVIKKSWKKTIDEEGCLSLPGQFLKVKRPHKVTVEAQTVEDQTIKIKATGLLAKVLQHEIDHLEGILITDKEKK